MHPYTAFRPKENNMGLYISVAAVSVLLSYVGEQGEPYAFALFYAALSCGLPVVVCAVGFLLSAIVPLHFAKFLCYAAMGTFSALFFIVFRRLNGKNKYLSLPFALISCALPALFFPLESYPFLSFLPLFGQKIVLCGVIFLLCLLFRYALELVLNKLTRCRLSNEELLAVLFFLCITGIGLQRAVGADLYFAVALFVLLTGIAVTKNATCVALGAFLAVPVAVSGGTSFIALYVFLAAMGGLFYATGKFPAVFAVCASYFAYFYFSGRYQTDAITVIFSLACCLIPCLIFVFLPQKYYDSIAEKLLFYRNGKLNRMAVNRNRTAIGAQLFTLSDVFRKIERAFDDLSEEHRSDAEVLCLMHENVEKKVCAACSHYVSCSPAARSDGLDKLLSVGLSKGKTTLMDLPSSLVSRCTCANEVLFCVNGQLGEYRKYKLDAENTRLGKKLLATQARGVSELLKEIALKESAPLAIGGEREQTVSLALRKNGIVCPEIMVYDEDGDVCVNLTVFGSYDSFKIAKIVGEALHTPLSPGEKLVLAADKYCFTLRKKPTYDAAFGVATVRKQGEVLSGDAYSVIRINEKRFLAALSDGMGSGQKAERISSTALSLLESFYRAGMPSDTVLSTVNKLLSFNAEENFVCLDVASVDLENGRAELFKIGSPLSFIFSESSENLRVLEGDGLPLGMLEDLHPTVFSADLKENDVLLFLSDGVTDAFSSHADLLQYLKTKSPRNPQALADDLLSAALARTGGVAEDDMTVLAVRIFLG